MIGNYLYVPFKYHEMKLKQQQLHIFDHITKSWAAQFTGFEQIFGISLWNEEQEKYSALEVEKKYFATLVEILSQLKQTNTLSLLSAPALFKMENKCYYFTLQKCPIYV